MTPQRDSTQNGRTVEHLLAASPSYRKLDDGSRQDLAQSLSKIATFLAEGEGSPVAYQMAPDLRQALAPQSSQPPPGPSASPTAVPGASGNTPAPTSGGGGGATGRVGEVARATLSAIDFPAFVASLIQGTFQAIVDASIQQMEAYATLLKNVASTVDNFMTDNVSDGKARDYLSEQYGNIISTDTSTGQPKLTVRKGGDGSGELPSFFKDLGFTAPAEIDDQAVEQVVVPAARRYLAESRQRTLATMVMMGINRVVVDDGEIMAKLQFHIDASDTMKIRFDQTKTTTGNMAGNAGRSPFSAQAVMVNTASLNTQSDINVRADLTGQVRVKFRSETFPLERFADSAAIQLINSNAKVPQPAAPAAAGAPTAAPPANTGAVAPAPAAAPATPRPAAPTPSAPAPAAQGLAAPDDPWAPEV